MTNITSISQINAHNMVLVNDAIQFELKMIEAEDIVTPNPYYAEIMAKSNGKELWEMVEKYLHWESECDEEVEF